MKKYTVLISLLIATFFVSILSACSVFEGININLGTTTSRSTGRFTDRNEPLNLDIQVREDFAIFRVDVNINVDDGSVSWMLTDPHGELAEMGIVWDGERINEKLSFDPIPGIWEMVLLFRDATGEYTIRWNAN
jgi:hypothetical protein